MFTGSFVALVTPYIGNKVDLDCIAKLIDWHVNSGTSGVVVCGSTGEGLLLSEQERKDIITTSIEAAKHRIQVIVGCSYASTNEAIYPLFEPHIGSEVPVFPPIVYPSTLTPPPVPS